MYEINSTLNIKLNTDYEIEDLLKNKTFKTSDEIVLKVLALLDGRFSKNQATILIQENFTLNFDESETIFNILLDKNIIIHISNKDKYSSNIEWIKRSWTPSLLHYSTSKNINFKDKGSQDDKELSKNHYEELIQKKDAPQLYKKYEDKKYIELPCDNFTTTNKDFYKTLLNRRTHREFKATPFDFNEFSEILFMSTENARNIRNDVISKVEEDTSLYTKSVFTCNELYLYINNVSNINPGIYHYDIRDHGLTFLKALPKKAVGYYCYGQPEIVNAAFTIFISANYENYMWRYNHERAYRNILIDVAQLAQSLILTATNLNKKNFLTPALRDTDLVELFDLEKYKEDIRYLVAIGN